MSRTTYLLIVCSLFVGTIQAQTKSAVPPKDQQMVQLTKEQLKDKIKGGWAGQTIGVTYGGPYEFKFLGTMMNDYQTIPWPDGAIKRYFDHEPGLFDDIYMDLSFVDVIEKYGVDAPVDSFANAFAKAPYPLWHANQTGRYNLLNGMKAPASGHWSNNPHADDIDFQIEADFAGLMHPGMARSASALCDKVGHIMNYGEGYYGGVYIANMYSLAFVSNSIEFIVTEALKSIPQKSLYYQCMKDVIGWYHQYPNDWKRTWFEVQRKWTEDIACPDGVFTPYDISARVNSAYVIMGLLYGRGDFAKTVEIATRSGQDADCNPSSAAGVLGTMLGYKGIPAYWRKNLSAIEDQNFFYTNMSLNKIYEMGFQHASQMIRAHGGTVYEDKVSIRYQEPKPVAYEVSFPGIHPIERRWLGWNGHVLKDNYSFEFDGTGFTLCSNMSNEWGQTSNYVFQVAITIDGKKELVQLPYNFRIRRNELFTKFGLDKGQHKVSVQWLNPDPIGNIQIKDILIYSNEPSKNAIK